LLKARSCDPNKPDKENSASALYDTRYLSDGSLDLVSDVSEVLINVSEELPAKPESEPEPEPEPKPEPEPEPRPEPASEFANIWSPSHSKKKAKKSKVKWGFDE
jgi:outer membrane biosynthesis protein TonB